MGPWVCLNYHRIINIVLKGFPLHSEYKQHNPFSAQGRDAAIKFLSDSFKTGTKTSKLTFFAGQGYGMQHFKMSSGNTTFAVVDYFKFRGTCIVEHWDVLQTITGTELNPIAFF
jgi:predicted SnoaL-like aldol condensation-catalyzing enzyme